LAVFSYVLKTVESIKVKYTIGIVACIAIAFLFITSPDKQQSHAQEEVAAVAPIVDDKLDSIIAMLEETKQRLSELEAAAEEAPAPEAKTCSCDCNGKCADLEKRIAALESAKALPSGVVATQGPVIKAAKVAASAPSLIVNRPGHWTYPGTINGHLESTHGVSTAGMSREQMLDLHDALHEGSVVAPSAGRPVAMPVSNCPGGVCPTGPSVQSRSSGWFLGKNLRR
jgi:hypothetical protein